MDEADIEDVVGLVVERTLTAGHGIDDFRLQPRVVRKHGRIGKSKEGQRRIRVDLDPIRPRITKILEGQDFALGIVAVQIFARLVTGGKVRRPAGAGQLDLVLDVAVEEVEAEYAAVPDLLIEADVDAPGRFLREFGIACALRTGPSALRSEPRCVS